MSDDDPSLPCGVDLPRATGRVNLWTVSHWHDNNPECRAIFDTEEAAIAYALDRGDHGDEVDVWTLNEPGSDVAVGSVVNYLMGPTADDPPEFRRSTVQP